VGANNDWKHLLRRIGWFDTARLLMGFVTGLFFLVGGLVLLEPVAILLGGGICAGTVLVLVLIRWLSGKGL